MKRKSDVLEYEDTITNSETQNTQEMDTQDDTDDTISSEDHSNIKFDLIATLRQAQYDDSYSDAENIHRIKQKILDGLKNDPSFGKVSLDTASKGSDDLGELESWKWIAILEALAESNFIKDLILLQPLITSAIGVSLATMLTHNTSITRFTLYYEENNSDEPIFEQAIEQVAIAIKNNKSIKHFEFSGCSNQIAINHILEGLGENNNIITARVGGVLDSNSTVQRLATLIRNNNCITKFGIGSDKAICLNDNNTLEKYSPFLEALKKNNNLTSLYTLSTQCPVLVNQEFINELRNVLTENNTLTQMLPFSTNQYSMIDSDNDIIENSENYINLLERNKTFIDKTVNFIKGAFKYYNTHNDLSNLFMDRQLLKKAQDLSKIGESLINEKLQEIDWTNNQEVRKYAEIYGYDNLKNYNYETDYQRFRHFELTDADYLNNDITINGSEDTLKLQNIQHTLTSNYFELTGICKNNNFFEIGLPLKIWQHIESFVLLGEDGNNHDFAE